MQKKKKKKKKKKAFSYKEIPGQRSLSGQTATFIKL